MMTDFNSPDFNTVLEARKTLADLVVQGYAFSIVGVPVWSSVMQSGVYAIFKKGVYPPGHNPKDGFVGRGDSIEEAILNAAKEIKASDETI